MWRCKSGKVDWLDSVKELAGMQYSREDERLFVLFRNETKRTLLGIEQVALQDYSQLPRTA